MVELALPCMVITRSGSLARMRTLLAVLVVAATLAVLAGVPAVYVFGPLLAVFIVRMGLATFRSLEAGADHIPDSDPVPVDPRDDRTVYWCQGCGAEMLLTVRGTPVPPRHCGERMTERRELRGDAAGGGDEQDHIGG